MTYEEYINNVTNRRFEFYGEVESLRARVAEAEARAQTAEAENGRLRVALSSLKRHCFKHHQGDDSCNCAEIEAALAASAPETGEREAESAVVVSVRDRQGYYQPIVSADNEELAHEFLARFLKEERQNDFWTTDEFTTYVPHLRAKALRAQAGGEGAG